MTGSIEILVGANAYPLSHDAARWLIERHVEEGEPPSDQRLVCLPVE